MPIGFCFHLKTKDREGGGYNQSLEKSFIMDIKMVATYGTSLAPGYST